MSDKKQSAKRKWKNALLAAALAASVILALPAWSVGPAEAVPTPSEKLVLKEDGKTIANSKLTITRAGEDPAKQGTITVDLYKVADAVLEEKGYDGYTLAVSKDDTFYSSDVKTAVLNVNKRDANLTDEKRKLYNEEYRQLARTVAEEVLASPKDLSVSGNDVAGKESGKLVATKDITGSGNITFEEELEAGLYLVIAHGKDLTPAEYKGTTADGKLVTMAYNNGYVYSYQPELIALPMRGTNGYAFSTAQSEGNWRYEVTAELKAEETVERVPLQITKTFSGAENALLTGKNGCVFRIEARLNGQRVYSNVVAVEFAKGQTTSVMLTEPVIPVGATVTVTEEYDGAAFTGEGDEDDESVTKSGTDITYNETSKRYEVSFTNTYNEINTGGDIVTNSFTKQTDGTYKWNNPRPAQGIVSGNNN